MASPAFFRWIKVMRYSLICLMLASIGFANLAFAEAPVVDVNSASAVATNNAVAPTTINTSNLTLDQRVTRLENILNNQSQLLAQINALQQQVQDLQGQVEVLTNSNQQLQQQQLKFYNDLDQRVQTLENARATAGAAAGVTAGAVVAGTVAPAAAASSSSLPPGKALSETDAYQAAFNSIKTKQYPQATQQLQAFIKQYPNSDYAPNAHYWLGELYLVQKQPDNAATEFNTLIKQYPQNAKVPDAMLKLAFITANKGDKAKAIKQLKQIQKQYPGTTVANLAQTKLASLK